MKFHRAWIASALSLAMAAPAMAADWGGASNYGGGVAVPVPAPAPVPTFDADSDWYVGLAIGGDFSQDVDINLNNANAYGYSTDGSEIGTAPVFGLSFGRYITPSLRWDVAIDYHRHTDISQPGTQVYLQDVYADAVSGGGTDQETYGVVRTDTVSISRTTGILSLIYDIDTGTRFKPFVGAGVGFTWRQMKREYSEDFNCDSSADFPANSCVVMDNPALPNSGSYSGSETKDQIDFAAAVQAGLAYEITESVIWDNSWLMLWENNSVATSVPTLDGTSTIKYSDAVLQQFRTGLRFRFN